MTDFIGGAVPLQFEGCHLFPVIPFTPLVGSNAIEWNSPLLNTGGYWSGANPTRMTIPALPDADPIGNITGSLAFVDAGVGTSVTIVLRVDGSVILEGSSVGLNAPIGRLSFTTGPREVLPGEYYELLYEFGSVTSKTIQIVGTGLSFTYLGGAS